MIATEQVASMASSSRDLDVLIVAVGMAGVAASALGQGGIRSVVARDTGPHRRSHLNRWKKPSFDMRAGWIAI